MISAKDSFVAPVKVHTRSAQFLKSLIKVPIKTLPTRFVAGFHFLMDGKSRASFFFALFLQTTKVLAALCTEHSWTVTSAFAPI